MTAESLIQEMDALIVVLAAILPAIILIAYIYFKDYNQREPIKWILIGVIYGVLSAFLALFLATPATLLLGVQGGSVLHNIIVAFCSAGIPEELAKFICLLIVVKKNTFFDERMDGIVYAVCIGMGFAGFENILYLFQSESWLQVGICRALISVPAHFFFAVFMGYFFSNAYFGTDETRYNYVLALVIPICLHAIFDAILFSFNITPLLTLILTVCFVGLCAKMAKDGHRSIKELLLADQQDIHNKNNEIS